MDRLIVRGAREHNLRDIDVELTLGRLIAVTGVSGSGKTSFALDTLHAEGHRRYLEALSLRLRAVIGGLSRADVDVITGLPPTVAIVQDVAGASTPWSTVATYTEVHPLLRVIFARAGTQYCTECGEPVVVTTHDEAVSRLLALPEGTRLTVEAPVRGRGAVTLDALLFEVAKSGFSRIRLDSEVVRIDALPRSGQPARDLRVVVDRIKIAADREARLHDAVRTASAVGDGVIVAVAGEADEIVLVDRPYCLHCDRALPALRPGLFAFTGAGACDSCQGRGVSTDGAPCPSCEGGRLGPDAAAVRWRGHTLPELCARDIADLLAEALSWSLESATEAATVEVRRRLDALVRLGLGHLRLDRATDHLPGGHWQLLRLARQLGAQLSGALFIFDEPTAGVDEAGVASVIAALRQLVEQGNTVLAVAHHLDVVRAADEVLEFGPGPGRLGGRIVYQGPPSGLPGTDTATARALAGSLAVRSGREPTGRARVEGLCARSLVDLTVELPRGAVAAIAGPNGVGKSTLLEALAGLAGADPDSDEPTGIGATAAAVQGLRFERVVTSLGTSPLTARSSPATFAGVWDVLRPLLAATREAQVRGFTASHFSLNVRGGRCEACKGVGLQRVELGPLPDEYVPCEVCAGRRFTSDVLEIRWKGRTAADLLDLTAAEAHPLLAGHPKLDTMLRALGDVGLGYVALGQPGHTLSGGEARRLRLARELGRVSRGTDDVLYLLDDPSRGLHPVDTADLAVLLHRLAAAGATVWAATHDATLIASADAVVRLG